MIKHRFLLTQMPVILFGFLAFVVFTSFQTSTKPVWNLAKNEDGIKIYTRAYEGSPLKEFKAMMVLNGSVKKIEGVLDDVEAYSDWQENVTTSKILKKLNDTAMYVYYTADLPWPIDDRDIVSYSLKKRINKNHIYYDIRGADDFIPENSDFIRIRKTVGSWDVKLLEDGKVNVEYKFFGDSGGNLPAWLINLFIVDGPHKTMLNLKNKIDK